VDLPLFLKVIWRFKLLVATGTSLAIALAFLSIAKVNPGGSPHVAFRQSQIWADDVTLLVAPQRFPWGGSALSASADPAVYGQLATIYANLATSDAVKQIVLREGPVDFAKEPMLATVVPYSYQNSSSPPLPLITLEAQAESKQRAIDLVQREARGFLAFLHMQQTQNNIPQNRRVRVSIVKADQIRLLKPRSKTVPIMIFMLVMIATLGLAFMLENVRPRVRLVPREQPDVAVAPAGEVRRTA
jgi:hypothetical protein